MIHAKATVAMFTVNLRKHGIYIFYFMCNNIKHITALMKNASVSIKAHAMQDMATKNKGWDIFNFIARKNIHTA